MHLLKRGTAPDCLKSFKHGKDDWSVISQQGLTDEIWQHLKEMQKEFCAYCECRLINDNKKRHIEHFFNKDSYPQDTFNWSNLFGSCNHSERCGKFKDHSPLAKQIDLKKVCKPDQGTYDPSRILSFLTNGEVRAANHSDKSIRQIAENTIKIFNLNGDSSLINSRRVAVENEKKLANEYWEMKASLSADDIAELLDAEYEKALTRISDAEYSTALKHIWEFNADY